MGLEVGGDQGHPVFGCQHRGIGRHGRWFPKRHQWLLKGNEETGSGQQS